jgi:hypothetical protein
MLYVFYIMPETWTVLPDQYAHWASSSVERFPPDFELMIPSARNLALLSLLANFGKECSYDDLLFTITASGVLEGTLPKDNLRVAIQDLRTKLNETGFQLRTDRRGREAVLQLVEKDAAGQVRKVSTPGKTYEVLRQLEVSSAAPSQIAWDLVRTRTVHHGQHYVLPRAASYWTTYSASETYARASFERTAYERLFSDWLEEHKEDKGICVLGLNVGGEGDAELNILRDLVHRFTTVHYLAIDLSGQLLTDHSVYLNHQFGPEIQSGRLVCCVKAASFEDPQRAATAVAEVRAEFAKKHPELGTFFPAEYPVFCSYLSNFIGNRSRPQSEWDVFNAVLSAFPKNPDHAFFVGFAALRPDAKTEDYPRDWFEFLTQTPRELLYNTISLTQKPNDASEFKVPPEEEFLKQLGKPGEKDKRFLIDIQDYQGAGPIKGHAYRFSYRTKNPLETKYEERSFLLEKEAEILLYQIVKFDPPTLAAFLNQMGLKVLPNPRGDGAVSKDPPDFGIEKWADSKAVGKDYGRHRYEHRYQLLAAFDKMKQTTGDTRVAK